MTPVSNPQEAIERMLQEKRLSSKINYDVLKNLNKDLVSLINQYFLFYYLLLYLINFYFFFRKSKLQQPNIVLFCFIYSLFFFNVIIYFKKILK
jgi:hypothetical protein